MRRILTILSILVAVLFVIGCSSVSIKEAKSEEYVGKTVTLSGKADNSIKIGSLSGYTLKDKEGESIAVKSDILAKEGSEVSVRGTIMKDSLFGYYLLAKE